MIQIATLNDIARGDATASEARELAFGVLKAFEPAGLLDLYHALRTWLWRTLDQRRRDPELRDWYDVIAGAAALVSRDDAALGGRLSALKELLGETIATGDRAGVVEVSRREHVAEVLGMLRGREWVDRAEVGRKLRLGQANLSRVLNMMASAGLLERTTLGKKAAFRLTRSGMDLTDARESSGDASRAGAGAIEGSGDAHRGADSRNHRLYALIRAMLLATSRPEAQERIRMTMKRLDRHGSLALAAPAQAERVRSSVTKSFAAPPEGRGRGVMLGPNQPRSDIPTFDAGLFLVDAPARDLFRPSTPAIPPQPGGGAVPVNAAVPRGSAAMPRARQHA